MRDYKHFFEKVTKSTTEDNFEAVQHVIDNESINNQDKSVCLVAAFESCKVYRYKNSALAVQYLAETKKLYSLDDVYYITLTIRATSSSPSKREEGLVKKLMLSKGFEFRAGSL
jgi:hypothetical protein